jgi:hypothetical protein
MVIVFSSIAGNTSIQLERPLLKLKSKYIIYTGVYSADLAIAENKGTFSSPLDLSLCERCLNLALFVV